MDPKLLKHGAKKKREEAQERADARFDGDSLVQRAANAGTVISVVVIGVVALVGVLIFSNVYDALPEFHEGDEETDPHPLHGVDESIMEGFGNAMEFIPIILLVLLASVVIAVVQRMRT